MPLRRCPARLCPQLVPPGQFCERHKRENNQRRGTSTQRGYGARHRHLRNQYAKQMTEGVEFICPRCAHPIRPGQDWDLGHNDTRKGYNGPEHASCNRKAGGINGNIASNRG